MPFEPLDIGSIIIQVQIETLREAADEVYGDNGPNHPLSVASWLRQRADRLEKEANRTIRYGTYTRHDGLEVRYREDSSQTDPDLALRFDTYSAKCGCYPTNTDDREWTCPHGARWTRLMMEPYGLPIEPEENNG